LACEYNGDDPFAAAIDSLGLNSDHINWTHRQTLALAETLGANWFGALGCQKGLASSFSVPQAILKKVHQ
jgi:hypothetical protein